MSVPKSQSLDHEAMMDILRLHGTLQSLLNDRAPFGNGNGYEFVDDTVICAVTVSSDD